MDGDPRSDETATITDLRLTLERQGVNAPAVELAVRFSALLIAGFKRQEAADILKLTWGQHCRVGDQLQAAVGELRGLGDKVPPKR